MNRSLQQPGVRAGARARDRAPLNARPVQPQQVLAPPNVQPQQVFPPQNVQPQQVFPPPDAPPQQVFPQNLPSQEISTQSSTPQVSLQPATVQSTQVLALTQHKTPRDFPH